VNAAHEPTPLERFDALLAQPVGTRSIAVLRIAVGIIAFGVLRPIAADALDGRSYRDRFHDPFLDWLPHPTGPVFTTVMVVGAIGSALMVIGLVTRWASAAATIALGTYLLASTTHLHNNRAYLFAVLVGLSLAPAGRSWSLDRLIAGRRGTAPDEVMAGWPLWLLRFQCSLVYAASGVSKLVDPDWFGGTVTWGRVVKQEALLRASILPDWAQDLLLERSFHTVAAKAIVLTELFIAAGLWWRPTRWLAVATAVVFHISIELSADVETFSYLAIAVLIIWADPDLRIATRRSKIPMVSA
jgi:uncharacterized membrane protein YphA (DoxX/SURF4 family)